MTFGATFLRDPQSWNESRSEQPCGDIEEVLAVAGGSFRCLGLSQEQARILRQLYASCDNPQASIIDWSIQYTPQEDFLPLDDSVREYTFDLEHRPDEVLLAGWDFSARIQLRPQFAVAMWTPHLEGAMFESAFANVFRVVVAYFVVEGGGALLHSAAVADGGTAQLFVGVSGSGKSTISQLALDSGRSVLSDDLNALWPDDGQTFVEQVPFTGDLRGSMTAAGQFPVAGIFRLRQGSTPRLRPLTVAETVALLFGCAPFVNSDPFRHDRLLTNLEACARDLPADELTFALDRDFWHLVSPGKAS